MKVRINLFIFVFLLLFYLTNQIEIYGILMFFVFLHELGHMIVGIGCGLKVNCMEIMPFGFSLRFQEEQSTKRGKQVNCQKVLVALAGPLVNILCVVLFMVMKIEREEWVYANLFIAFFNLLPIYPLDGGRILETLLDTKWNAQSKKEYLWKIAKVTMILLTGLGSILIFYYQNIVIFLRYSLYVVGNA